jgi:hypothetical protein
MSATNIAALHAAARKCGDLRNAIVENLLKIAGYKLIRDRVARVSTPIDRRQRFNRGSLYDWDLLAALNEVGECPREGEERLGPPQQRISPEKKDPIVTIGYVLASLVTSTTVLSKQ